jgi:predicted nucleic acid-binding protein
MSRPVLLDNTVLSNLALTGRDDLPFRLWGEAAATTAASRAEYQAGVEAGLVSGSCWGTLPVIELTTEEDALALSLSARFGPGERTCLAVAAQRKGMFASDDLHARRAATRLDVPITGTVGILAACVRRGYLALAEANRLLDAMIAAGYRSPIVSLDQLLDVDRS